MFKIGDKGELLPPALSLRCGSFLGNMLTYQFVDELTEVT